MLRIFLILLLTIMLNFDNLLIILFFTNLFATHSFIYFYDKSNIFFVWRAGPPTRKSTTKRGGVTF